MRRKPGLSFMVMLISVPEMEMRGSKQKGFKDCLCFFVFPLNMFEVKYLVCRDFL
jgi:hypothetical protein